MRRTRLAISVALALVLLGSPSMVSAAPVPAATGTTGASTTALAAPVVTTAFGDRTLTVDWEAVPGAGKYLVEYSTSSTFSKKVRIDRGLSTSAIVTSLKNGTRYYARVLAVPSVGTGLGKSKTVSAVPEAGYPRELNVTVVPSGSHSVRVSWTGQGRATKVAVIAGSEGSLTKHPFSSKWYPATTTSVRLTVPTELRSVLGTGTGNPIFVKVATYNSMSAGSSTPRVPNAAVGYRLSPAGEYSWAGEPTPTGTKLRVATWNVNSVAASRDYRGYTWADRRTRVAAGIEASGANVVATQELTTADAGNGKRQWEDLRDLLAKPAYGGYSIANPDVGSANGGTKGAHIFYQASVLTRLDGAIVSADAVTPDWPSGLTDRYFSWAHFRHDATGKEFLVASLHLPSGDSADMAALRVREAKAVDSYLSGKAYGLPIVVMGDFNSSFAESPSGAQKTFVLRGYSDAASTLKRTNPRYPTANMTRQIDNTATPGYPYTPYKYQYAAPRIDYIFVKDGGGSWASTNRLVLDDAGKFVRGYQGSDHNMQAADIAIP
jgi:endonuclease/exonuclease/phosphatase family metal-dependent hydrolase